MEHYVGLDVSLKLTAICIVDRTGKIEREGVVASEPEAIAAFIKSYAPNVVRIGLETGPTATWLWTELRKQGLPVICIDARHAKAALKMQINKSDRNDAVGIARIMQCGWYKEVRVKESRQSRDQGPPRQSSLCSLRSSGILRTKSAASSRTSGSSSARQR
jgi:transposase